MAILDNNDPLVPANESDTPFQPTVTRWAIIATVSSIILTLVQYLSGVKMSNFMAVGALGLLSLGLTVFFMRSAVLEHRNKELGGYISFQRAFIICVLVGVLSGTLSQIFNFVYLNYLSPNTLQTLLEGTREMMENLNAPEEQIDQALEGMEESLTSPKNLLTGPLGSAFISAIIGSIVAAVLKRKAPFS